jgi:Zn-dependent protease with chaperone function
MGRELERVVFLSRNGRFHMNAFERERPVAIRQTHALLSAAPGDTARVVMTTKATNPMATLYRRLSEAGVQRAYVQDVILPEWWSDALALGPTAFDQALGYVARSLGYKPADLRGDVALAPPPPPVKYKLRHGVTDVGVATSASIALRAALLASRASRCEPKRLPERGTEIRNLILGTGKKYIGLPDLLDYCWAVGIVVLHVSRFPKRKMDGLAAVVDGRPVIVVSRRDTSSARLLFVLAHELGHLVKRHVTDGARVDDQVEADGTDRIEQEANEVACELLTGTAKPRFRMSAGKIYPSTIVEHATAIGAAQKVHPATIALHWAWHEQTRWPTTMSALKKLEGVTDVTKEFRRRMQDNLDLNRLSEDDGDFLRRVSEWE